MAGDNWTPNASSKDKGSKSSEIRLLFMLAFTFSYFLVEIIVGYMTRSMALVADSFHMLSDVLALLVAYLSVKLSKRKWSRNTFGLARAEILGALINAVFLFALCFSIVVESVQRFVEPEGIKRPDLVLYVGGFGLLVNLIGLGMFHNHGHSHGGHGHSHSHGHSHEESGEPPARSDNLTNNIIAATKNNKANLVEWTINNKDPIRASDEVSNAESQPKTENLPSAHSHTPSASQMNIHGVFLHILADALGSVVVIISALIMWFTNWEYKDYVDPLLSVILVILICYSTWPLLIESSLILLQTVPKKMDVQCLQDKLIQQVSKSVAIHDLHIWQLTGSKVIATAHIICQRLEDCKTVLAETTQILKQEGISSTTIQLEFSSEGDGDGDRGSCTDNSVESNPCLMSPTSTTPIPDNGESADCHRRTCCSDHHHHNHSRPSGQDNAGFIRGDEVV